MIDFTKKEWFNINDEVSPDKRIPISAANLNRIEGALAGVVEHTNNMTNHWWEKNIIDNITAEIQTETIEVYRLIWDNSNSESILYYSDGINVRTDSKTGKTYAELNNPKSQTISYKYLDNNDGISLSGKYHMIDDTTTINDAPMYYDGKIVDRYSAYGENGYYKGYTLSGVQRVKVVTSYKQLDNVSSENENTYPDGWSENDKAFYKYLGVPFENSISSTGVITGWYFGNGDSTRIISVGRKPKLVLLYRELDDNYTKEISGASYCFGIATKDFSSGGVRWRDDGFEVGTIYRPSTNDNVTNPTYGLKYIYIVFY